TLSPTTLAPTTLAPTTLAPTTAAPTTEAEKFVVSFDSGDGSAVLPIEDVLSGAKVTEPTPPTFDEHVFMGWYKEASLDTLWDFDVDVVTESITLYAKWAIKTYTVTFDMDGADALSPITDLLKGALVVEPDAPVKTNATFLGWYKELAYETEWDFLVDTIEQNTTIYAKWDIPGTPIATAQAFYDMTMSGSERAFYLTADINFADFTWVQTGNGQSFKGHFEGFDHVLSNITITGEGSGVYGGLFQRATGASIQNVKIVNASIDVNGRAGVLIGRVENDAVVVQNITFELSTVKGTAGEGVGILVGNASHGITADHIVILSSSAFNTGKNVSLLVGRADHAAHFTDIYIFDSQAESQTYNTDAGVGGIVGYTNSASADLVFERIVIEDSVLIGRSNGALVGYYRYGGLTATDVFLDIAFPYDGSGGAEQSGIIGRRNVDENTTDPVLTRVFGHFTSLVAGAAIQLDLANTLADLDGLADSWWLTQMPNIPASDLWHINELTGFYTLLEAVMLERFNVEFESNGGSEVTSIEDILSGSKIAEPEAPTQTGYLFLGWYKEATFDTLWDFDTDVVLENLTLYADWAEVFNVTFDTGDGSQIDPLLNVISGSLVTPPEDPSYPGHTFEGWYHEATLVTPWDFESDTVLSHVTLYAKWEVVLARYTVTFDVDGADPIAALEDVLSGATITAPDAPEKTGFHFGGWYKEASFDTLWDFDNETVTENMTLYAQWIELFSVTFDSLEGSAVDPLLDVLDGATINAPANPTRSGWTFLGWYKEASLLTPWDFVNDLVLEDITLYAKWGINVVFNTEYGSAVSSLTLSESGTLITAPDAPVKAAATFLGWFKEATFDTVWDFESDVVTGNMTLFAKWDILGMPITTAVEFINMAKSSAEITYYLANDIDFTGVDWVQSGTGTAFKGVFDGRNHTLSNITITGSGTGVYGGIFQRTNGATIKNVVIQSSSVSVEGRVGMLIGRVESNPVTIHNVIMKYVLVNGTDSNGVGLLIGMASLGVSLNEISIISSTVQSTNKNVGLLIGRVDNFAGLTDIYIHQSKAETTSTATDAGVGVIGYTNHANANLNITRLVVSNSEVLGGAAGALVGYYKLSTELVASDVFLDVNFTYSGAGKITGLLGRRDATGSADPVLNRVYGHFLNENPAGNAVQLDAAFALANLDAVDEAWWATNMQMISSEVVWDYNPVTKLYQIGDYVAPEMTYSVTFEANGGAPAPDVQDIEEGNLAIEPEAMTKSGHTFEGWFKEATFDTPWNFLVDTVTENITLYAKWIEGEPTPDGVAVTTVAEFYELATKGTVNSDTGPIFYLANDLDFTEYTWVYVNFAFTRTLNGNGKTIANLTIPNGGDRAGIFSRVKGATIYNLTLDNVNITSSGRAGILVGELYADSMTAYDITITNSSVSGNNSNGVGALVGYAKTSPNLNLSN
ncbi:MAG: InlB B-repeat-containing protein, partial [Candidatus Izemoplasmatales bacterium]|nr:InlB B-repeat-containing protein [Candidatus Izemoplasmatales bacterium]